MAISPAYSVDGFILATPFRRGVFYSTDRGETWWAGNFSLLDRRVSGLSGGERQRVALARALMSSPDILLLDEPLAAVDLPLRRRIVASLRRIRDDLGVPVIYVTHDPAELRSVADTVIVLDEGRVVSVGPPDGL